MGRSRFLPTHARKENIVLDAKEHLLGRTAAVVARQLLEGQNVTCVRCDRMQISGPELRNKRRFLAFLRKKHLTNPKKGPFHFRSPRMLFRRVVRGMLPKDKRGQAALARLRVFEGCPKFLLSAGRRKVIPNCLRPMCLDTHRSFTDLGQMCTTIGWNMKPIVDKYEAGRAAEGKKWADEKAKKVKATKDAYVAAEKKLSADDLALLKKFGFAMTA
eukprot:PhM_4_TR13287/c0_g1_i1/m.36358/K02872/RP-L13Ae, RPL13A; large subunit ribosomal protein L13Ae